MIKSFGNRETEKIWFDQRVKKYPLDIQRKARIKLRMLDASTDLADLKVPPSNKLEKLKGNLSAYYSIRVNKQWRIIFKWDSANAYEVEFLDYH